MIRTAGCTYFLGDLRIFGLVEALRRLIPVSAHALRCQLNLLLIFANYFAQTKVCDFDLSIVEQNILGFQVVMDYFLLGIGQILQTTQDLRDDELCLLFLDLLGLFEIVVEVRPTAQLQNGAETIVVDLNCIKMLHHASVVQLLVDLVFPEGMLYVVIFHLVIPTVVEVVDLAGNLAAVLQIEGLVHLREASLAQDGEDQVPIIEHSEGLAPVDATVLGLFLVPNSLVLHLVSDFLLLKHV